MPPPHQQHRTRQPPDHTPKEAVCPDVVVKPGPLPHPPALQELAAEMVYLGIALGKTREISEPREGGSHGLHGIPVEPVRIEIGPVGQKRVLLCIDIIPVLTAFRIKTAMSLGRHGINTLYTDVPRQDGIQPVDHLLLHNSFKVKVKIVLQRVNAGIGPGSPGHDNLLPEKNGKCFFYLFLYGSGIGLDLETTVGRSPVRNL